MKEVPIALGIAGLLLFALGLVLGFAIPAFRNSRMALSAHLTAVQTGTALIATALFWQYCSVPEAWDAPIAITLGVSSYILVAGIALAGASGASSALPIAGKGFHASALLERLVGVLVGASSVPMFAAIVALCWFALDNS
ncbi:hypothetical protein VCJ71_04040 [Alteriqipengyuania sp. WL0013]|uniref:hypothetical protein n=1 Tax=Alteriqipengyuania sp. WL0013 TaxID=3110773 RepID=UPI002CF7A12D|nr:hypothetical protein [Alteriqipengyuania sp. WL0013]MEB3415230.1 hypothetical protein [Alteriqipengyuania sp. WL0013]